jgi:hypothetical protein
VEHSDITTEELHLVHRVLDCLADLERGEEVSGHVLAAASELVRIAYRARTLHDPMPGQARIDLGA